MGNLLLILAAFLNTVPRLIDFGTGVFINGQLYSDMGKWWYYTGQAASLFLIMWSMEFKRNKCLQDTVFWLSFSNLMDEMFFDPKRLGINELLFAFFIITWETYKNHRKTKNGQYTK
jgi:hypothetical protein